jgi:hypothetical protein
MGRHLRVTRSSVDAQSRAVAKHKSSAILQTAYVFKEPVDFFRAEHDRMFVRSPDTGKTLFAPRHFQSNQVEKLHGGDEGIDALRGKLLLVQEVEFVLPEWPPDPASPGWCCRTFAKSAT